MPPLLHIIWILLLGQLLLPAGTLHAQEKGTIPTLLIGPAVSLNLEQMNTSVPAFPGSATCGEFTNGWSYGPSLGVHITSPSLFTEKFGIGAQVQINALSGIYRTQAPEPFIVYDGAESTPNEAAHEYRLNFRTLNARLNVLLDFALTRQLHFTAGPSIGIRFGTTLNQTDYITDGDYRFTGGRREIGMSTRTDLQSTSVIFGTMFGATYQYTLNEELLFAPHMFFRTEFTPFFDGTTQFTASAGLGVMVLTSLFPISPSPPDPARIPSEPKIPRTPLSAFISVQGIDENGSPSETARIQVYETYSRAHAQAEWEVATKSKPPTLLIQPYYSSSNGIRDWRVRFLCKGEVLGVATSENPQALSRIDWRIASDSGTNLQQLKIELHVTDSANATVIAQDSIPLAIQHHTRTIEHHKQSTTYALYPVDDDQTHLTEENRQILKNIAEQTGRNDSIRITGTGTGSTLQQMLDRTEGELRKMLQHIGIDNPIIVKGTYPVEAVSLPIQQTVRSQIKIVLQRTAR